MTIVTGYIARVRWQVLSGLSIGRRSKVTLPLDVTNAASKPDYQAYTQCMITMVGRPAAAAAYALAVYGVGWIRRQWGTTAEFKAKKGGKK